MYQLSLKKDNMDAGKNLLSKYTLVYGDPTWTYELEEERGRVICWMDEENDIVLLLDSPELSIILYAEHDAGYLSVFSDMIEDVAGINIIDEVMRVDNLDGI